MLNYLLSPKEESYCAGKKWKGHAEKDEVVWGRGNELGTKFGKGFEGFWFLFLHLGAEYIFWIEGFVY